MNKKFISVFAFIFLVPILAACEKQNQASPVPQQEGKFEGTIVAVGDSLTAGLGVSEEEAYPSLLQKKLLTAGIPWRVVNAGISGETSSGVLSRVNWIMKLKPDIVILETGANDGLRGIDPQVTRKNIDQTIARLKQNKVLVVLAGMRMVTNMGREFTGAFSSLYPGLARKHGLILVPFFLEGVAGDPSLNQGDGIHPTAEGYRTIVETVYPHVVLAVNQRKAVKQTR